MTPHSLGEGSGKLWIFWKDPKLFVGRKTTSWEVDMLGALTLALTLTTQSGVIPAFLPDTPQGRYVSAYIEAFNAGEAAFVPMYETAMTPAMAAQTSPARRAELYRQLVRQVGKIKVEKLVASSSESITFSMRVPGKSSTATFTFRFEEKTPFRISGIDMEVSDR